MNVTSDYFGIRPAYGRPARRRPGPPAPQARPSLESSRFRSSMCRPSIQTRQSPSARPSPRLDSSSGTGERTPGERTTAGRRAARTGAAAHPGRPVHARPGRRGPDPPAPRRDRTAPATLRSKTSDKSLRHVHSRRKRDRTTERNSLLRRSGTALSGPPSPRLLRACAIALSGRQIPSSAMDVP
jgi:hypothetical protein